MAKGVPRRPRPSTARRMAVREEVLGPRHPHTANSYNNVAANLHAQGRAQAAQPLKARSGCLRRGAGPRHPHTASTTTWRAISAARGVPAAEAALREGAGRAGITRPAHTTPTPPTATTTWRTNLYTQGRSTEAQPLYRKALADGTRLLGLATPSPPSATTTWLTMYKSRGGTKRPSRSGRRADARKHQRTPRGHHWPR